MWWFNIFALFWNMAILNAICNWLIVVPACMWYFSFKRDHLGAPISKALGMLFEYHWGTICFGGLVVAITWIVNIILSMIYVYFFKFSNKKRVWQKETVTKQ